MDTRSWTCPYCGAKNTLDPFIKLVDEDRFTEPCFECDMVAVISVTAMIKLNADVLEDD